MSKLLVPHAAQILICVWICHTHYSHSRVLFYIDFYLLSFVDRYFIHLRGSMVILILSFELGILTAPFFFFSLTMFYCIFCMASPWWLFSCGDLALYSWLLHRPRVVLQRIFIRKHEYLAIIYVSLSIFIFLHSSQNKITYGFFAE